VHYRLTRNFLLLVNVPPGVVTVTKPVVAPPGRWKSDITTTIALAKLVAFECNSV
jgi:hypothetical protein